MTLPFTWTLRSHCRVINWPNFDTVVSQGIRRPKNRERSRRRDGQWNTQNTHGIFQLSPLPHLGMAHGSPKAITVVTSKITDWEWPGSPVVGTLCFWCRRGEFNTRQETITTCYSAKKKKKINHNKYEKSWELPDRDRDTKWVNVAGKMALICSMEDYYKPLIYKQT